MIKHRCNLLTSISTQPQPPVYASICYINRLRPSICVSLWLYCAALKMSNLHHYCHESLRESTWTRAGTVGLTEDPQPSFFHRGAVAVCLCCGVTCLCVCLYSCHWAFSFFCHLLSAGIFAFKCSRAEEIFNMLQEVMHSHSISVVEEAVLEPSPQALTSTGTYIPDLLSVRGFTLWGGLCQKSHFSN